MQPFLVVYRNAFNKIPNTYLLSFPSEKYT